jgi:hypothetical protein
MLFLSAALALHIPAVSGQYWSYSGKIKTLFQTAHANIKITTHRLWTSFLSN